MHCCSVLLLLPIFCAAETVGERGPLRNCRRYNLVICSVGVEAMETTLDRPRTAKRPAVATKTKRHVAPRKPDDKTRRLIEAIKGLKGLR